MKLRKNCVLVVGASSGIGEAVARKYGKQGFHVALVARRGAEIEEIAAEIESSNSKAKAFAFPHDVSNLKEIPDLFDSIVEKMGGLDYIVYAAGAMPEVDEDEYNTEKDELMVKVNLLGMMGWLNEAADFFSRTQQGTIIGIGSIAGDRGRSGQPGYNTTKGAQAIFLEALRNRLASKNIRVVTIKPGYVDTAMTAGMGNLLWMISADEAARQIYTKGQRANGVCYVPGRWRFVALIIQHIPGFIFRKLNI